MTLFVLPNEHVNRVVADLQRLCPDPGLAINAGTTGGFVGDGRVSYIPTMSSVGCDLVNTIAGSACWVGIRGETKDFPVTPTPGDTLVGHSGVTIFDAFPGTTTVEVAYDVTNCAPNGRRVFDGSGAEIDLPTDVLLVHELAHVAHLCTGTLNLADPEGQAIAVENQYRASRQLPARAGHAGGCRPGATTGGGRDGGCFVASAVYDSAFAPPVNELRDLRDEVVGRTRAGTAQLQEFYHHYERLSPPVVALIEQDPALKRLLRWAALGPIVSFAWAFTAFPEAPLDDVPSPWRGFLSDLRDRFDQWGGEIGMPSEFVDLTPDAALSELEVVLRFGVRAPAARTAYLTTLARNGHLPLATAPDQRSGAAERLRTLGLSHTDVNCVLGSEGA